MSLKEKILENFEGKVVRKDLATLVKGSNPVPVYVLEYLLGQYCAIDDEDLIRAGVEKVKNVIKDNYVHRSDSEIVKHKIRELGSFKIIDKISVSLNDRANIYQAEFANLGLRGVPIPDAMVSENSKLLSGGGVWCILTMGYSHAEDVDVRWIIVDLKPIQVANVDLQEYIELRKAFTTEEWLDLLMHSIGLNPEYFSKRDKFIQLSRLIPHVENNFNFIELGPKGTGKSHIFSELSPHGVLVSGGDVSKARLFVNNTGNKIGLVGYWDVVALDEFEQENANTFALFQFMIGNTDWKIRVQSNVKFIQSNEGGVLTLVPYDFDSSGFVAPDYARPFNHLGLSSMKQRLFMGQFDNKKERQKVITFYKERRENIYAVVKNLKLLDNRTRYEIKGYLDAFYRIINTRRFLEKAIPLGREIPKTSNIDGSMSF